MNNQRAIDRLTKHLEWGWSKKTVDAIEMGIHALKETQWIPCSERLPEFEEIENERPYLKNYKTKEVLVQTKHGEMFVAWNHKKVYTIGNFKDEYSWYSQGTGGRRMRVMSKVVAWMPLPEPYKGE